MTWAISCGTCSDAVSRYSQFVDRKIVFTDLETDKGKRSNMANMTAVTLNFTVDAAAPTTVTVLPLLANNTLLHQSTVSPGQTMSYSPVDLAHNPPIMFQLNGITVSFPSGLAQQPSCYNGQDNNWNMCNCTVAFPSITVHAGAVDWIVTFQQLSNVLNDIFTGVCGTPSAIFLVVTMTAKVPATQTFPRLLRGTLLDGTVALTHRAGSLLHM